MYISRGSLQGLCDLIEGKPSAVLGNKFFDVRLVTHIEFGHKPDKYESRILVLSKFRLFIISGKNANSLKIDRSYHILCIRSINVVDKDELSLICDESGNRKKLSFRGYASEELALHFLRALRHYFPDICAVLPVLIELQPRDLYHKTEDLVMEVTPRPCHSFRRSYAALCDFYDLAYRDEVSWDVEKIYTANNIRDLRFEDFSHLLAKDLIAIVAVLQYSSYFTGLFLEGMKLSPEMVDVVLSVVRYSVSLRKLQLSNCGLTKEFPVQLATSLQRNQAIPLEVVDLSKNLIEDKKGIPTLTTALARLPGVRAVLMSECNLSEKSSSAVCGSFYSFLSSAAPSKSLTHISLASNPLKDDLSSLINLLSVCTSLRILDLSDTQAVLDRLWPALKFGCLQLEKLLLAGCQISKKPTELGPAKDFFAASVGLSTLDLRRSPLQPDLLRAILSGLSTNHQLAPFTLLLDGSCEKCGSVLEECLPSVRASVLSLRDNNFEAETLGVVTSLSRMPSLRRLDIGGANLTTLKKSAKHGSTIGKIIGEMVKLVAEETKLEELSLSDAHLGSHLTVLLNSLGASSTLRLLDISYNDLGTFGARILSKALQVNTSLRCLLLDGNHLGTEGLSDIASALALNHSLLSLPSPLSDAAEGVAKGEKARVASALAAIEERLGRNRNSLSLYELCRQRAGGTDGLSPLPDISSAVSSFACSIREATHSWLRETLRVNRENLPHNQSESLVQVENAAIAALEEAVTRDAHRCISEWCWRETVLSGSEGVGGAYLPDSSRHSVRRRAETPSDAAPSPIYRPRSIFNEPPPPPATEESVTELDQPPKPSSLIHPSKTRARPAHRLQNSAARVVPAATLLVEEDNRSSSPSLVSSGPTSNSCCGSPRLAMVPDKAWLQEQQESAEPEGTAGGPAPPPLPRRHPPGAPPLLPPKPDKSRDQSPAAAVRRSVADMARLFTSR